MKNYEKALAVLKQIGEPLCDDCLSDNANFKRRQIANSICNTLSKRNLIDRKQALCTKCAKFKKVNIYHGISPSISTVPKDFKEKAKSNIWPWYWEGNVQSVLVTWLVNQGYSILEVSNTAIRSQGKDIRAVDPKGRELWVSVKGYPENSSHTQARHYFADALLNLILYRNENSSVNLAMALPDGFATYSNLAPRISWLSKIMPMTMYWISARGNVRVE